MPSAADATSDSTSVAATRGTDTQDTAEAATPSRSTGEAQAGSAAAPARRASGKTARGKTTRRTTINLRRSDDERLQYVAEKVDGNDNDAVRHALATTALLQELVDQGGTVVVVDANGRQREIQFIVP